MVAATSPHVVFGRTAPTIPVSDVQRALSFYVEVLGFQKTFENGSPVGFVILKKDTADIHLTRVADHKGGAHNVMHLMVSDATTLFDHVLQKGVRIIKGVRDAEFGLKCFVMADPDGNRIDVGQPI
jgi:catechol 2,3-dioxygenase-like lactoylglutathione lyase family enzyme